MSFLPKKKNRKKTYAYAWYSRLSGFMLFGNKRVNVHSLHTKMQSNSVTKNENRRNTTG